MAHPGEELEVPFRHNGQLFIRPGPVARNLRLELRREMGMVEPFLFVRLQVRLRTAHPEDVALQDDFPVPQGVAVVAGESFQRQGEQSVYPRVHKFAGLPGLFAQEVRPGSVG